MTDDTPALTSHDLETITLPSGRCGSSPEPRRTLDSRLDRGEDQRLFRGRLWSGSTGISNKRSRTSLEGWTFDPDLIKPGISSFPWPIWDSTAGLLKPDGPFSHYHGGSRNVP